MEIIHDPDRKTFSMIINGYTGYVSYQIRNGKLDILHTVVPFQIGGQGVASQLVKAAYDYAINSFYFSDSHRYHFRHNHKQNYNYT